MTELKAHILPISKISEFERLQMYSLFHAQMCFDMGFTTLRDLGMNSSQGLLTGQLCSVRDSIDAGGSELPIDERRLTRARRAVEKAAGLLREPDDF